MEFIKSTLDANNDVSDPALAFNKKISGLSQSLQWYEMRLRDMEALAKYSQDILQMYASDRKHNNPKRLTQIQESLLRVNSEACQIDWVSILSQVQSIMTRTGRLQTTVAEVLDKHQDILLSQMEERKQHAEFKDKECALSNRIQEFSHIALPEEDVKAISSDTLTVFQNSEEVCDTGPFIEQETQLESTKINTLCCSSWYNSTIVQECDYSKIKLLCIMFEHPPIQSFLKKTQNFELQGFLWIMLNEISKHPKYTKRILQNLPVGEVESLTLSCESVLTRTTSIGPYLKDIVRNSHKIKEKLELSHFTINEAQLSIIFVANKDKKVLKFSSCKFSFSGVPNFDKSLKNTSLQELDLSGCEVDSCCGWVKTPSCFEDFMQSLANTDLKKSLKTIEFGEYCLLEGEMIREVLHKCNLGHIDFRGRFQDDEEYYDNPICFDDFGEDYD